MAIKANACDLLFNSTVLVFYRSLPVELPNRLVELNKSGASEDEIYKAHNA